MGRPGPTGAPSGSRGDEEARDDVRVEPGTPTAQEFGDGVERKWLGEQGVRHRNLADVVQLSRRFKRGSELVIDAELAGEGLPGGAAGTASAVYFGLR